MENYTSSMNLCPSCIIKIKLCLSWEWERYEEVQCSLNCSPYIHKLIIYLQTFLKCHLHPQQSNGLEFLFHHTHTASVIHLLTAYFIRAYSIWNLFPRNIPHTKSLLLIPFLVFVLMLILLTMKFPKIKSTLY